MVQSKTLKHMQKLNKNTKVEIKFSFQNHSFNKHYEIELFFK